MPYLSGFIPIVKLACNLKQCEESLKKAYDIKWIEIISNKPKLRSFKKWKESFGTEPYVKLNLVRNKRSILAQIRSGTLPLKIETWRFVGIKYEDRLCNLCQDGAVETETRFMLKCKHYDKERKYFLAKVNIKAENYNEENLLKLMFQSFPRQFAKFCSTIMMLRNETEYKNNTS